MSASALEQSWPRKQQGRQYNWTWSQLNTNCWIHLQDASTGLLQQIIRSVNIGPSKEDPPNILHISNVQHKEHAYQQITILIESYDTYLNIYNPR